MSGYNFSQLTAMIVDDCPPIRILLRGILKEFGITRVVECSDGREALREFPVLDPDVVFTDYMMEPMDGLELIRTIRNGETSGNRFVPIVVVSAYTEVRDILAARDHGATEFLAKPVSGMMVYKRLKSIVEHPREFVDADTFFGPDRRRRAQAIEDSERREVPYEYRR
jgi:two-component system chemotaxis response regulator CheY